MVNDALKAAMTSGEVAAEAVLIADQPWLGLPIVKQLLEWLLDQMTGVLYGQAADAATKIIIDLQVGEETSAVNSAFSAAQAAIASGDANAITTAQANLSSAFGGLINSDGSATT